MFVAELRDLLNLTDECYLKLKTTFIKCICLFAEITNMEKIIAGFVLLLMIQGGVNASPTVYILLGSGNQVIAVDAATDKIIVSYPDVINAHSLVATPVGIVSHTLSSEYNYRNRQGVCV